MTSWLMQGRMDQKAGKGRSGKQFLYVCGGRRRRARNYQAFKKLAISGKL